MRWVYNTNNAGRGLIPAIPAEFIQKFAVTYVPLSIYGFPLPRESVSLPRHAVTEGGFCQWERNFTDSTYVVLGVDSISPPAQQGPAVATYGVCRLLEIGNL